MMIRSEQEYRIAVGRLDENTRAVEKQREALKQTNLSPNDIEKALEPSMTFYAQVADDVAWYERVKRGDLGEISRLSQIGPMLIALRLAQGMTEAGLATKLGVTEAEVLRDERNEYHGISTERAQRIFDVLGVRLRMRVQLPDC